ncbi:MAG: hypothetical protein EA353_03750 [Puniceicoccaceae bacterium]|nr:MAG: hypothetical protein EA353_03750 [Puniceicoccaceae bacterium]
MPAAQKNQSNKHAAKAALRDACELAGSVMTTQVHGYSTELGRRYGEPVVAATLTLDEGVSIRICLTPAMAAEFAQSVMGKCSTDGRLYGKDADSIGPSTGSGRGGAE